MLLGTLSHSGKVRGVLGEKMDQAHLIEAIDEVLRHLGGTARVWRTDRLATVIVPGTSDVQASFAPVAKHYGAVVEPCPPRRGNRKGAVESSVRFVSGRWWRTMSAENPEDAQRSLDVFCATIGDDRERRGPNGERTSRSNIWEMMYEAGWTTSPEPPSRFQPRPENPEPKVVKVPRSFMLREVKGTPSGAAREPARARR